MSSNSSFIIKNALLASKLSKKVGNKLSVHGVSLTEYLIMDYLSNAPQKAVSRIELAEHIGMSASGITRLFLPMEKNNIVQKLVNPRDARQSLVQLSQTGQQLYDDVKVSFEHIADDLLSHISKNQITKAVEIYDKFI